MMVTSSRRSYFNVTLNIDGTRRSPQKLKRKENLAQVQSYLQVSDVAQQLTWPSIAHTCYQSADGPITFT